MIFAVLGILLLVPLALVVVGILVSAPRHRGPRSDHFDGARFTTPGGVKAKGALDVLKWMAHRKREPWLEDLRPQYGKHPLAHFKGGIRITFVNHATFLIQVDGINILTDPVWSKRVSPFTWMGPKRMKLPGLRLEDLPRIDVVALSHNHYDHLDVVTMRTIFAAHHPRIITPLGIKQFLERHYISGATEGDWWDEFQLSNETRIQLVPAQHFSGRGLLDRDATLWCGYVIRSGAGNIYFAADTGYNQAMFRTIRERCGPIKVSMLPIGAYKPAWFMAPIHVSPEEAVKAHLDIGSETSIPMHFGTFPLADDGEAGPVDDLRKALQQYQVSEDAFPVLKEGEFRVFE